MNIALIGYGKMGKEIEQVVLSEKKHQIVLKISDQNMDEWTVDSLKNVDVAIEFTQPDAAFENVMKCFEANVPVVVGTTAWNSQQEEAKRICIDQNKTLFVSPNYSIGVNVFFELNKQLAQMMHSHDYEVTMTEIHHTEKKDAPSGTAVHLANDLMNIISKYKKWHLGADFKSESLPIDAQRIENVPGTHIVNYQNDIDQI
jgi:4-hydroxy-tetrahydrodipicolinate reductase